MAAQVEHPRKKSDVKWKRLGRAGILLDLKTGNYFELDEVALAIWKMLDGKTSPAQVASKLTKTYDAPLKSIERDVVRFVSELRKRKLIDTGNGREP